MGNKQILLKKAIGQIVVEDFRTARVFKNHKIDFYFQGSRNIQEVANEYKVDAELLLNEIEEVQMVEIVENINFQSWPLDLLVDYIEKRHHRFVKDKTPVLRTLLKELCRIQGKDHPELFEVVENFDQSSVELSRHMKNEEIFLFPAVRELERAKNARVKLTNYNFGSLQNPVKKMIEGHRIESQRFKRLNYLTNGYSIPKVTHVTYIKAMKALWEFENDLQTHIHLENNILFIKMRTLENRLKDEQYVKNRA